MTNWEKLVENLEQRVTALENQSVKNCALPSLMDSKKAQKTE